MHEFSTVHKFIFIIFLIQNCFGRPKNSSKNLQAAATETETIEKEHRSRNEDDDEAQNAYNYDDKGAGVYEKIDEIIYPYQQYTQVRHSYSVEHLPIKDPEPYDENHEDASSEPKHSYLSPKYKQKNKSKKKHKKSQNLLTSASTNDHGSNGNENSYSISDDEEGEDEESSSYYSHGYKPRLTEEIEDYKKQEVYEEKGYSDAAYDHGAYGQQHQSDNPNQGEEEHSSPTSESQQESRPRGKFKLKLKSPHLSELPASTKLLEHVASNYYDKDAHEKGIYAARENIYCPEVIDFDLSSKKMGMGKKGKGSKPRLRGLGDKIKCLKEKYFGKEPLPKEIFMAPSESRVSVIKMPSFEEFYKSFRNEMGSLGIFQTF